MSGQKKDELKQAPEIQWDVEETTVLQYPAEGHIRDTSIYITAPLWKQMGAAWGGVVTHVKTSTNVATAEVTLFKAQSGEPGAVLVRMLGAQNSAEFSFFRPLTKLKLKVPANRQFNVVPFTREVEGLGTVFVFPLAQRESVPRNRKEESATGEAQKTAAADQPEA